MRSFFIVIMMLLAVVMVNAQARVGVRDDISTKGTRPTISPRKKPGSSNPSRPMPPQKKSDSSDTPPRPSDSHSSFHYESPSKGSHTGGFRIEPASSGNEGERSDSVVTQTDTMGLRQQPSTKGKAAPNDTINGNLPGVQGSRTLIEKDNH
jgi:hypothetical protein